MDLFQLCIGTDTGFLVLLVPKGHLKADSLCVGSFSVQSMRLKLIANNTTVERRFSSWIGGSILASLVSKPVLL